MKPSLLLLLLMMGLLPGVTGIAAAPFSWKFNAAEKWQSQPGLTLKVGSDGLTVRAEKAPAFGGKPEIYRLSEPGSLRSIGSPETIAIRAELLSGGGATIGLYLKDAQGECFSYPQRPLKPGVNDLHWSVTQDALGSWGKNKNGKIDFPVALEALFLHQYPAAAAAEVRLSAPKKNAPPSTRLATLPLFRFDNRERWNGGPGLKLAGDTFPLTVSCETVPAPGGRAAIGRLREVFFPLKDIGDPAVLTLDAELTGGDGVTIGWTLMDATGEHFSLKQKNMVPGRNHLEWRLPEDIAGSWGNHKNGKIEAPVSLTNLEIFQYPASQGGRIKFLAADKKEFRRDVDAVSFRYETGQPFPVLCVGDESRLGLVLTNHFPAVNRFEIRLTLRNIDGMEIPYRQSFELQPGETRTWSLPWSKQYPRGLWRATLEITSPEGRQRIDRRTSLAYMQPSGPNRYDNPEFILGYNLRQQHWSPADQRIEALAAALSGAKLLRTGYTWESIETRPGEFHFEQADRLRQLNAEYHMERLCLIGYTPNFAARPELRKAKDWNDWNKSAPDPELLERYVKKLAEHYRGKIRFYEFWNEPDLDFWRGTLPEYLDRLHRVRRALKAADPDAVLISGGIASCTHAAAKPGFKQGLARGGQQDFDCFGYHEHGDFATFERSLLGPLAAIRQEIKPDKPLFFTETGFYVVNGNYLRQAANVIMKIVFARSLGARGYIWFDLRDDGFQSGYCEHNYGLMTNDWYPKEGYPAYNTLNLLLARARFGGELHYGPAVRAYWFRGPEGQVIACWPMRPDETQGPLTVSTDAVRADFVDLMGNATALPVIDGRVTANLPRLPGFITLDRASQPPQARPPEIVSIPQRLVVLPAVPSRVTLRLDNPTATPRQFRLDWINLPGVTVEPAAATAELPPGATRELAFTATVAPTVKDNPVPLVLKYRRSGQELRMACPLNLAAAVAEGAFPTEPQFRLNRRAHLVSLMEHNPFTTHRIWTGPADLSAEVFLAEADGCLKVRIKVVDDVHTPSARAEDSYMQDGLQLALAIPGQPGHWEFGLAELSTGKAGTCTWLKPDKRTAPPLRAELSRQGQTTVYDLSIPMAAIGLTDAALRQGIRFNLLINDNDGEGRDGWLQIAPGIGEAKNSERFPYIIKTEKRP